MISLKKMLRRKRQEETLKREPDNRPQDPEIRISNLYQGLKYQDKVIQGLREELDSARSQKVVFKEVEVPKIVEKVVYKAPHIELGEESSNHIIEIMRDLQQKRHLMGQSSEHDRLKDYAEERLQKEGFKTEREKTFEIKGIVVRVDVYAFNSSEKIAVECGTLSRKGKLDLLFERFDRVIWIPYKNISLSSQRGEAY